MEIPGYYYDEAKKKYFKIQANHVAAPGAGAQYTTSAVKRKRTEQASDLEKRKMSQRVAKERVTRSPMLLNPLLSLEGEIASSISNAAVTMEHQAILYASQLKRKELYHFHNLDRGAKITNVIRIPNSGDLFASANIGAGSVFAMCSSRPEGAASGELSSKKWTYGRDAERDSYERDAEISSIAYSPAGCVAKTVLDDSGTTFTGMYIDPNSTRNPWISRGDWTRQILRHMIWSSSACPRNDKAIFACGTDYGMITIDCSESPRWFPKPQIEIKDDIVALEWMSTDVVAAGARRGPIIVYDYRIGMVSQLQNQTAIDKIRKVDDRRLLVSGHGILNMHDLRFVKNQRLPNNKSPSTRPYLEFPEYAKNSKLLDDDYLDFDVCPELGLGASVGSGNAPVLFSLKTTKPIPSPMSQSTNYSKGTRTMVKFESFDNDNSHAPQTNTLLAWSDCVVDQWSW